MLLVVKVGSEAILFTPLHYLLLSEMLYIIWLNVEVLYLLLQLQKVKGIARE